MKINRAFQLKNCLRRLNTILWLNRQVTFEYIMLEEVNDGEQALELAELLKNIKKLSYVNLIP